MKRQGPAIVFFDAGETLVYPHPSFAELFAEVCRSKGHDVSASDVRRVQDELAPHLVDLAEDSGVEKGPTLSPEDSLTFWTYLYRRFLGSLGVDQALALDLYRVFSKVSTYRLFDDALPVLEALQREGYRLGLISNFDGWLEKVLVELQVGHLFEVTVISGVDGVEKPDPGIYELALERAAVPPAAAVHVGDSITLDVRPAREVGMKTVLLDRAERYPQSSELRISSLEELPPVLAQL